MEESLGSGFDSIRAAIMSPASFSTGVTVSPVFTQTMTDLERPSYVHLAGAETPVDSGGADLFSHQAHVRIDNRDTVPARHPRQVQYSERSTYSDDETHSYLSDERSLESAPASDPFYRPVIGSTERLPDIEYDPEKEVFPHAECNLLEWNSTSSDSEDEEEYDSDSDDTRKFHTEVESYYKPLVGDDDSDDYSDDYDSDDGYERSHVGQMLASINRYDYRYHRYWDAEHPDPGNTHFDIPVQASKSQFSSFLFCLRSLLTRSMFQHKNEISQLNNL
jgi:hypothetical protein